MAAAAISFVNILLFNRVPSLQRRERAILMNYEEVRISLAHDDLATAQRISAQMAREFDDWPPVSSSVQLISNSDSLESARKAFAKPSEEAIRLAERHTEYLILRCPTDCPEKCVNCRSNEFGSWVQLDLWSVIPLWERLARIVAREFSENLPNSLDFVLRMRMRMGNWILEIGFLIATATDAFELRSSSSIGRSGTARLLIFVTDFHTADPAVQPYRVPTASEFAERPL